MSQSKHTPTPWKTDRRNGNFNKGIIDIRPLAPNCCDLVDSNRLIATVNPKYNPITISAGEADANAKFIVRACNAHDDLVAALERFVNIYQSSLELHFGEEHSKQIRAALAKAKAVR